MLVHGGEGRTRVLLINHARPRCRTEKSVLRITDDALRSFANKYLSYMYFFDTPSSSIVGRNDPAYSWYCVGSKSIVIPRRVSRSGG